MSGQEFVVGFLFAPDFGEVLLIEKDRPEWQAGLLNGLGGKVEPGEMPLAAMRREFREEAGLDVSGWELFCRRTGDWGVVHCFAATGDVRAARTVESEPVRVVPVRALPTLRTVPSVQWMVPLALDPERVAAVVTHRRDLR